jgi:hypothetical protein
MVDFILRAVEEIDLGDTPTIDLKKPTDPKHVDELACPIP